MIYKASFNHKGSRATFEGFVWGCSVIVFQVCDGFSLPPFDPTPPYFGGSHLTHFFIFFNDSTFCGCANSRATISLGNEIQRSTLQKFTDLRDANCSVTGLATLGQMPQDFKKVLM